MISKKKIIIGAIILIFGLGFIGALSSNSAKVASEKSVNKITVSTQPTPTPTDTIYQTIIPTATPSPTPSLTPSPTPKPTPKPTTKPAVKAAATVAPKPSTQPSTTTFTSSCQYSCTGPDRDCADFSNHPQAQTFFNCCGFNSSNDPMRLDRDHDGLACEN